MITTYTFIILACNDVMNAHSDCFVFILMTHGMHDNFYCGSDGQVNLNDLLAMFLEGNCPESLKGKPKLFFIQVSC